MNDRLKEMNEWNFFAFSSHHTIYTICNAHKAELDDDGRDAQKLFLFIWMHLVVGCWSIIIRETQLRISKYNYNLIVTAKISKIWKLFLFLFIGTAIFHLMWCEKYIITQKCRKFKRLFCFSFERLTAVWQDNVYIPQHFRFSWRNAHSP